MIASERRIGSYTVHVEPRVDKRTGQVIVGKRDIVELPVSVPEVVRVKRLVPPDEDELLISYAEALRRDQSRIATAAARSSEVPSPHIRDNLFKSQQAALEELTVMPRFPRGSPFRGRPVLEKVGDGVRINDPDLYLDWLERAYVERGATRLNPEMRAAIEEFIGRGRTIPGRGADAATGAVSNAGILPGTHAEILAVNDLLEAGARTIDVATLRSKTGAHFIACPHCAGILRALGQREGINLRILTGASVL
jgi:hypothetical protein